MQRALFARVVVQYADLILLDEPFNAIDEKTIRDLIALIQRWQDEGRTVIVVAHDLDLVRAALPTITPPTRSRPRIWCFGTGCEGLEPIRVRHATPAR